MDNNFDFESKKYIILLVIVCLLFVILIIKAFEYLPDNEISEVRLPQEEEVVKENTAEFQDNTQEQEEQTEKKNNEDNKSGILYKSNDYEINSMFEGEIDVPKSPLDDDIVQLSDDSQNKLSPAEIALKSIINGRKYTAVNDYTNALNEYKKAIKVTNDKDILAEVYDGIAQVYVLNNNYKTALSFAQKANELSSSSQREFMIAKIYYASGQTNDAINRINKILKSK